MVALKLLKAEPSSAYFTFHQEGRIASHLAVDTDRKLYIRLMNGDKKETEIPLGEASPENFRLLRERLRQIEDLVSYLPHK